LISCYKVYVMRVSSFGYIVTFLGQVG